MERHVGGGGTLYVWIEDSVVWNGILWGGGSIWEDCGGVIVEIL